MRSIPPVRNLAVLASLAFLIMGAAFAPFLQSGISTPESINPYLNGVFPEATPGSNIDDDNWSVVPAYPNLTFTDPVSIIQTPEKDGFFIAGKRGHIWKISDDTTSALKKPLLNIQHKVHTDGDAGLINMILHPEFGDANSPNRGYVYVIYRYHANGDAIGPCGAAAFTRLSRFTKTDGIDTIPESSELVLIQQYDPHCWHTGGGMFFDTSGYFYVTFGDIGAANDSYNSGQQIDQTFFGGLLRIDVDKDASRSHPILRQPIDPPHNLEPSYSQGYFIPNDNPWLDAQGGTLEEFYALGLRSPHRASYDSATQLVIVGDVGQGQREEISFVGKGDNLQWPFKEGTRNNRTTPNPIIGNSRGPRYEYTHSTGTAIIGGFIYRGAKFKDLLDGKYLYGDHGTRNIYRLDPASGGPTFMVKVPAGGTGYKNGISSFGTDAEGNIYVLKLFATDQDGGSIYKIKTTTVPDPPLLLSQTGAFTDLISLTPASGLIPYDVNTPLWSDGAVKKRWMALPNNGTYNTTSEQIEFSENEPWTFPEGTVFIKQFDLPIDRNNPQSIARVETRFVVVKADGATYGVTYKWNDQGTDATLVMGSDVTKSYDVVQLDNSIGQQVWNFPSRSDCSTCHTEVAGHSLGIKTWQLNGDYTYPSLVTDNQLNTWNTLGIFDDPLSSSEINSFSASSALSDSSISLETRVRSYLDANCAQCHQPNGVEGAFDARFSSSLAMQGLINTPGIGKNTAPGNLIVKPRDHTNSELWIRDHLLGGTAMPPLAKNLLDSSYLSVLENWIKSIDVPSCSPIYLSDFAPDVPPINGWGPIEIDMSNGSTDPNDGDSLSINGVKYGKGLGVHAYSEIKYDVGRSFDVFKTYIGVDDETCEQSSIIFQVYLDDVLSYESPVMTKGDDAILVQLNIENTGIIKLIVDEGTDSPNCDHGNWAEPRLYQSCDDGDTCTTYDIVDLGCDCRGNLIDANQDGICDSLTIELAIKVFLGGPLSLPLAGEEHLMRDDLRSRGLLPAKTPYGGTDSIAPFVLQVTGPNAIVDWVLVQLRDSNDSTQVISQRSGLLQRDGDVVDVNGTSPLSISAESGNYFILVTHRNHLNILTAEAIALATSNSLDFTTSTLELNGARPMTTVSGRMALWAGDVDGTGYIDAGDRSTTWNMKNMYGYLLSDCTMDGFTDASDRSTTWNSRNQNQQIPD